MATKGELRLWPKRALPNLLVFSGIILLTILQSACGPAATPTPTVIPTSTPTPEPTATPTATPEPPLVRAVLTLEDLPAGFEELDPATLGLAPGTDLGEGLTVANAFGFVEAERFQFVFGFTVDLTDPLLRAGFEHGLTQPESFLAGLTEGLGTAGEVQVEEIPGLDNIGDGSRGVTALLESEGGAFRLDLVVFRRASLGVFLAVMYVDGETPLAEVGDLAQILAERAVP